MASYEILRTLDRGGMAEVFLARLVGVEGFEKRVVLKRVLPHLSRDRRFVERFLDEARLAAGLSHPNIVQIFELGQQHGQLFIAMEHVDGRNLREIDRRLAARGERMPLQHALRVACCVCEALHYAHSRTDDEGQPLGIVHRDVSPSNVLISFDGAVKLIDFGIAKTYGQIDRTRPGAIVGKCGYMSPEQCRGERLDARSDLFSCGALLYRLVTGRLPFPGDDDASVMFSIAHGHVLDPRELEPGVDDELAGILLQALAPSPDDRFPRALEMQLALEGYLQSRRLVSNTALLGEYARGLFEELRLAARSPAPEERTESRIVTLLPTDSSEAAAEGGGAEEVDVDEAEDFASQRTVLLPADDEWESDVTASGASRAPPRAALLTAVVALGVTAGVALAAVVVDKEEPPGRRAERAVAPPPGRATSNPLAEATTATATATATTAEPEARDPAEEREEREGARPPHEERDDREDRDRVRSRGRRGRRASKPEPERREPEKREPQKRASPRPTDDRPGFLTLDTQPWSEVFLGEARVGMTPIASHELPPGRHVLTLVNKRAGLRRQVAIDVRPGKTTRLRLSLDDDRGDSAD